MLLIKLVFFLIVKIIAILQYRSNFFSQDQLKEDMRDQKAIRERRS